jgi:LysR family glycine cleavage system transcriptional activator
VREGLHSLQRCPSATQNQGRRKLRVAVTPTFARSILMPRLKQFLEAYPEIDITLQVSIPLLDVVAEEADLTIRFGTGRYADVEHLCLTKDEVTPLASPAWIRKSSKAWPCCAARWSPGALGLRPTAWTGPNPWRARPSTTSA